MLLLSVTLWFLNQLVNPSMKDQNLKNILLLHKSLLTLGLTPGTAPFEKRMLEYVAGKTKGAERGVGNVSIGGITIDTGAAAKAAGTIVGQGVANIENPILNADRL
jgi:hypothetical protein